jgi:histidine triad (HIT) family protein
MPGIIVYEDEHSLAFLDHYPINPGHTLVIPKKHYVTMMEMPPGEVGKVFETVRRVSRGVAKASKADGINIGQSNGVAASQEVFHMHVHVIPRFHTDSPGGITFPQRKRVTQSDREKMGDLVRKAIEESDQANFLL